MPLSKFWDHSIETSQETSMSPGILFSMYEILRVMLPAWSYCLHGHAASILQAHTVTD